MITRFRARGERKPAGPSFVCFVAFGLWVPGARLSTANRSCLLAEQDYFCGVKETLSIKVSPDTKARLRDVARARQTTPSALLREALDLVIEGGRSQPSLYELNRDLLDALGPGGPEDLSCNPAHLAGFGQ